MPYTFSLVNRNSLYKFGSVDIWDVLHNVEAGIKYWLYCREFLKYKLERTPTVAEIAMGYNGGAERVAYVLKYKGSPRYLCDETKTHGRKVQWYYDKIKTMDLKKFMFSK